MPATNVKEDVQDMFAGVKEVPEGTEIVKEPTPSAPVQVEILKKPVVEKPVELAVEGAVTTESTTVVPPTVPVPAPLTADNIKEIVAAMQPRPQERPQVAPAPRPLYKVKPEDMDKFIAGGAETADYMNAVIEGVMNNMAELIVPYIEQRIAPLSNFAEQAERERLKNQFVSDYEDLKDYVDVAEEIANKRVAAGAKYKDRKEFFDDVAKETRSLKKTWEKRLGSSGVQGATPVPQKVAPPTVPGTGAPRSGAPKKVNEVHELFS